LADSIETLMKASHCRLSHHFTL